MVKCKTKIAWMLSLVLVVAAVFANVQITKAETIINISISLGEGVTATNYGVDYQVVDSEGKLVNVDGNTINGNINQDNKSFQLDVDSINEAYFLNLKVSSAGFGINLNGEDFGTGNEVRYTIAQIKEMGGCEFQLFKSQTSVDPPAENNPTYTIDFTGNSVSGNTVSYDVDGKTVTLTPADKSIDSESKLSIGLSDKLNISGFDRDTMEIAVCGAEGFRMVLGVFDEQEGIVSTALENKSPENNYPQGELKIEIVKKSPAGDPPPGPEGSSFSGSAYFVWRGADDKICAHLVTGLGESKNTGTSGEPAYKIIYIPVSEVKDDVTGEAYNISNNDYYWMWDTSLGAIGEYSNYTEMNEDFERNESLKRDLAIDPTEAVNGASTVCTNGNRDFRATIYADTFEGLDFSVNPDDYTYFPDFWDSVFASNTVDISGSTAENPAVYESFLLEPTVHFSTADNSANAITGIEALDVPAGAVAITGDAANGYDIKFNSNFFDSVVFEITTASENYYLEIVRTALQVHDNFGPDMTEPGKVIASLYYDEGQDYRSYEVYATIYNSDGTTTMKKAEAVEIDMDNLGKPMPAGTYVWEAGKGLKYSNFAVEVSDDVVGVAFNVVEAGALSGESYGGSYLGSGIGAYYDIETREVVY